MDPNNSAIIHIRVIPTVVQECVCVSTNHKVKVRHMFCYQLIRGEP